jgi:hypothetical protein
MSLPAEASAKAGATAVSPAGFPVHGRAGTALRLAGKMPVPRCAYTARRIVIVYRPPGGRARISYVVRPDIFGLVARDPVLVGVLHVGVGAAGFILVVLHTLCHRAPGAVLEHDPGSLRRQPKVRQKRFLTPFFSGTLTAFRDRVAALRKEWEELAAVAEREEDEETRAERRNLGKLRKGVRTPESAYYVPILQVLEKMGGGGKVADVLERLGKAMKPILKDVDYDPLASGPDNPRWRNAAQWARNSMVREGLLKADSHRGVWEITEKGRAALKEMKK